MKPLVTIRAITDEERQTLGSALRSRDAFTVRRAQVVLWRDEGQSIDAIAKTLRVTGQNVRLAIHAFNKEGEAALLRKSHRPKSVRPFFDAHKGQWLLETIKKSPRVFGRETSLWTTRLLAQVAFEQGVTHLAADAETVRRALVRLGVNWKRAKKRLSSPDPAYERKKSEASD